MPKKLLKIISLILCFLLCFEQSGFAQVAAQLDISGHLAALHQALTQDKFRPLHLRYLSYDSLNNNFKLLLDKGDFASVIASPEGAKQSDEVVARAKPEAISGIASSLATLAPRNDKELEETTKQLLNYFFIGISLPNDSFWVNLRPDSPDKIIDSSLAKTDIGKILLEADVQLKKDTAKATSPDTPEGRQYWDKLYQKAEELLGYSNLTIPTLTRPWIVPGEIIIRETPDNAYIYKATLKVMLEEDYLKAVDRRKSKVDSKDYTFSDPRLKELNTYSTQLLKELIIPKLTKEINTSKRYAPLRQVYYSLIMAQWFKARYRAQSIVHSPQSVVLSKIDSKDLTNLTSKAPWSKETYFQQYQKSFKDGEYKFQEPVSTPFGRVIRSYMSGGIELLPKQFPAPTSS